ncbi:MAG: hypothetical protein CVU05_13120 [Bacteroidetes bacterium HGW-Bacteroidetes-21]|nr:MAG: hypothetical protein CVU05_13120 [Bacteroidetes bacterium HGW-Bacteroidetes-21]
MRKNVKKYSLLSFIVSKKLINFTHLLKNTNEMVRECCTNYNRFNMLKNLLLLIFVVGITTSAFSQSGTLKGKVLDGSTGEGIAFANVSIESNGQVITGGMTDFDGNYTIKPVPAGVYDVKASYVGYQSLQLKGLRVMAGKITFQDFKLGVSVQNLQEVEVREYKVPLISKDQTQTGGSVTSEEIAKMPGRSADAVAVTVGGVYSERGEVGSIRGARDEATVYYIDGVKVRGSTALPKTATAQVDVITGGIPAKYGDVTGGIISVTTKEPSRETFGGVEFVTSKFLDPYNYNLAELMFTGPLLSRKSPDPYDSTKIKKDVIAGYFISASYNFASDDYPAAIGTYQAKEGVIDNLLMYPYRPNEQGSGTILNAEYLTANDFEKTKARKDAESSEMSISGKVDFKPSRNINLTAGATMAYSKQRLYNYENMLFNSNNNGTYQATTWRTYLRLTQKFGGADDKENVNNLIKNAFYQIQVDYSKVNTVSQDDRHKKDFFKYGYVGKFTTTKVNSYGYTDTLAGYSSGVYQQNGFRDLLYDFEASDINPDLASYTNFYYSIWPEGNPLHDIMYQNSSLVQFGGGLLNGQFPDAAFYSGKSSADVFNSPGTPYNTYALVDNSQFRINASGSADLKDHEISLGFEFEQRNDNYFGLSPAALWTLGRNYTNYHVLELDYANPNPVYDANGVFQDTIWYNRQYNASTQSQFDMMLREQLGMAVDGTNWIDFDSYDPSTYSIDFFSADELFNSGNAVVAYYGYDHHGNKIKSKPSLNDFYTSKDENGRFLRPIASFEPIYAAGYIQDKFAFKDLIFNVGVRFDRFDANQMTLKDPYSFYETKKVSEVAGSLNPNGSHPGNIASDAVVYGDNVKNPTTILGYREGTDPADVKWYDATGTQITDPSLISSATGMSPILLNADEGLSANAFKDYEPQLNVMPRVSFSFPISDVALFFAHYDILTKRPVGAVRLNPFHYLFIQSMNNEPINNPSLKPEKTIDYEIGFQQKLSGTSALKLSAFYRDMRDMAQVQFIYGAYPMNYMTYTNIDFGTVKGFTLSYDMRRTGNITLRASYTLQFANGTGSNIETNKALITAGQPNLRTTIPLDFDQRHAIVATVDYRFASGRQYNGPKVGGKDIFQNTGANFVVNYGTGSPYSRRNIDNGTLQGSINGSRKPSRTTINMRLDRDIELAFGKKEGEGKKKAFLNVYFEISNILNTLNVINVYSTTGNPDDDGWLTNAASQVTINSTNSPESFVNYYQMYYNYPYNYSSPRTIRLGVQFNF